MIEMIIKKQAVTARILFVIRNKMKRNCSGIFKKGLSLEEIHFLCCCQSYSFSACFITVFPKPFQVTEQ
jgi:hypothetical protein